MQNFRTPPRFAKTQKSKKGPSQNRTSKDTRAFSSDRCKHLGTKGHPPIHPPTHPLPRTPPAPSTKGWFSTLFVPIYLEVKGTAERRQPAKQNGGPRVLKGRIFQHNTFRVCVCVVVWLFWISKTEEISCIVTKNMDFVGKKSETGLNHLATLVRVWKSVKIYIFLTFVDV